MPCGRFSLRLVYFIFCPAGCALLCLLALLGGLALILGQLRQFIQPFQRNTLAIFI